MLAAESNQEAVVGDHRGGNPLDARQHGGGPRSVGCDRGQRGDRHLLPRLGVQLLIVGLEVGGGLENRQRPTPSPGLV
jgi:hypothetical protein